MQLFPQTVVWLILVAQTAVWISEKFSFLQAMPKLPMTDLPTKLIKPSCCKFHPGHISRSPLPGGLQVPRARISGQEATLANHDALSTFEIRCLRQSASSWKAGSHGRTRGRTIWSIWKKGRVVKTEWNNVKQHNGKWQNMHPTETFDAFKFIEVLSAIWLGESHSWKPIVSGRRFLLIFSMMPSPVTTKIRWSNQCTMVQLWPF